MMTLKQFKNKIKIINEIDKYCDKLSKIIGIEAFDIRNSNLITMFIDDITNDITTEYGKEGWDWVDWWTFDKKVNPTLKAFDAKGEEIDSIEKLYNMLKFNDNNISKIQDIEPDED